MKKENLNILTVNCGSSSIKFALYETYRKTNKILSGHINRIGLNDTAFTNVKIENRAKTAKAVIKQMNLFYDFVSNTISKNDSVSKESKL